MKFAALLLCTLLGSTVFAQSNHTPDVCAEAAPAVCAHLGYRGDLTTTKSAEFMLHFMNEEQVKASDITNLSVDLWMENHDHGSAPVKVTPLDEVHYRLTEATFPMAGTWQVRVTFDYQGTPAKILIPLEVK